MGGFAGYFVTATECPADLPDRLRGATDALRHRGPDQAGEFFAADVPVGMGFARLSILDPSPKGRQPMTTDDGDITLTYNGEMYNYRAQRAALEAEGVHFRSGTDSEVVLHLYRRHGPAMLRRIDGMFALVVYDRRDRSVFAARDRFGKKPLYFAQTPSGLYWASEFRALTRLVPEPLHEDLQGFWHYTTFNCYPRRHTYYREIQKLLPGHWLSFRARRPEAVTGRYYRLTLHRVDKDQACRDEQVRELFAAAVSKRLMGDVPVGVLLSGGIDSAAIAMQAAKVHRDINTFSVTLEGDPTGLDEIRHAGLVAAETGATHHEAVLTEAAYVDEIQRTAWDLDEPLCLPDAALLSHLSRLAADAGVKVLLSGEGSDEVFCGYDSYISRIRHYYENLRRIQRVPRSIREAGRAVLRAVGPHRFRQLYRDLGGREFLLGGNTSMEDYQKAFCLHERVVGDPSVRQRSEQLAAALQRSLPLRRDEHLSKQIMLHEFNLRLPDLLLMRVDKVTMAHSIETRCPFLDRHLVHYGTGIDFDDLYDGRVGKVALHRALAHLLPGEIASRPKVDSGGDGANRTTPAVARMLKEVIADSEVLREFYSSAFLESVIAKPVADVGHIEWNMATFALWRSQLESTRHPSNRPATQAAPISVG